MSDLRVSQSSLLRRPLEYLEEFLREKLRDARDAYQKESLLEQAKYLFLKRLGRPNFVFRPAVNVPYSADYNAMVEEAISDIQGVVAYAAAQAEALQQRLSVSQARYNALAAALLRAEDFLSMKRVLSSTNYLWEEDFTSSAKILTGVSMYKPAHVSFTEGLVSLQEVSLAEFGGAVAEVVADDSNGWCGNTHEYAGRFVGEQDTHGAYGAVLDGKRETWFEYEAVTLKEKQAYGTTVDMPDKGQVSWDAKDEALKLHLRVSLPEPRLVNSIVIDYFVPPQLGGLPPDLEKVLVYHDGGFHQLTGSARLLGERLELTFPPVLTGQLSFFFRQPHAYDTMVARVVYYEVSDVGGDYLQDVLNGNVPGRPVGGYPLPYKAVGLNDKGGYDAQGGNYKAIRLADFLPVGAPSADLEMAIEQSPARRRVIGIRNIVLKGIEFSEKSEIILGPYPVARTMYLAASTLIPDIFPSGEWVEFYLSLDGAEWFPVRLGEPYSFYQNILQEQAVVLEGNHVYSKRPVDNVYLRLVLSRPSGANYAYYSPLVYSVRGVGA